MELNVIQEIGNFKVVPTLALFQNKKTDYTTQAHSSECGTFSYA